MSLLRQAPRFDTVAAARLARGLYGLETTAAPLPSERDQNFHLTSYPGGEHFVLKIANAAEDRATLEAQDALMAHLAPLNLAPRVVAAASGDTIMREPDGHFIRLLTWLPGVPLATIPNPPDALFEDLGRRLAQLDRTLAGFDHAALHRDFHWDLARAFRVVQEHGARIADAGLRGLVERTASHVEVRDGRTHARLRRSVIHGDANDHNVVVTPGGQGAWASGGLGACLPAEARSAEVTGPGGLGVRGFVDFGDAVYTYTVADLAIAIAYAVLDQRDPLRTAVTIARAYRAELPLEEDELSALFGLVQLRLCASVCMAAYQQPDRPSDAYLDVSQAPIRRTLPVLAGIHPDAAEEALRSDHDPLRARKCGSGRDTLAKRRALLGSNLKVGYRNPLKVSRGWMQYLFDDTGRQYLDAYNNVPHVGHAHPRIVAAAVEQMRALNTNTRYLYDTLWQFAERLAATLPEPLRVCYFVNSGSEANELALRLARAHTGHRELIVQDAAYHGNTTTLIEISPYKFNGPGGQGKPAWVHVVPVPDDYRGAYKRGDAAAGVKYANGVGQTIEDLRRQQRGLCGFIAETCPSVGGQIVPPAGYLEAVYRHVREAGGVCIADEVQTAYGRMGTHFYAFEAHTVVPDIVVLGKPIGNGYPLGAVVTTSEIAASFDNGMEFFSTFGGSTVSCTVGLAVLDVIAEENLQAHALRVGEHLLAGLRAVGAGHEIVGDVRGSGLFFGVELVRDRDTLEPAGDEASRLVNRMREDGVLIGTDGPFQNVLKIRPPMPFAEHDSHRLLAALESALGTP
jgi:4-aminobutyrate aminotransferase-like enzyme/Ser/Thr protein kinase RdoA (MazF antagonist)